MAPLIAVSRDHLAIAWQSITWMRGFWGRLAVAVGDGEE